MFAENNLDMLLFAYNIWVKVETRNQQNEENVENIKLKKMTSNSIQKKYTYIHIHTANIYIYISICIY